MSAAGSPKRDGEMREFWSSLHPKVKSAMYFEGRLLVMSSDDTPLTVVPQSRLSISNLKTPPKFYLFSDAFVVVQGVTVTEYPLESVWVEHTIPTDNLQIQSLQHIVASDEGFVWMWTAMNLVQMKYIALDDDRSMFRLVFPEGSLELQCKELIHKSKWVMAVADCIGNMLQLQQFVPGRGDMNLDTKLELLKNREGLEFTFKSLPDLKDGRYKGEWRSSKPNGRGEFTQETTGILFSGDFKEGKFHGSGEMHWFSDKDTRKKYIGEFKNHTMEGHGEMKYSNGDIYSGHWVNGQRSGFGKGEETSRKGSFYIGGWKLDKKNGYGIYENKVRHERYLGMWMDDVRCGPGMVISSCGTYHEAVFTNGTISAGHDGFVIDPNGKSFIGKLGPDLKLMGKGTLVLDNGTKIEGTFSGSWSKKIEIIKGSLEDRVRASCSESEAIQSTLSELQIAKLDTRIGNCTVLACNKWQEIFKECENTLGVSGDAANDVFSAWNRLASDAYQRRNIQVPTLRSTSVTPPAKRSNSLTGLRGGRTVKVPVQLIPLERARAATSAEFTRDLAAIRNSIASRKSMLQQFTSTESSISETPEVADSDVKPDISRPLNLEESLLCCSYPSGMSYKIPSTPYAPQADLSDGGNGVIKSASASEILHESQPEFTVGPKDVREGIQSYVDKAFNTPDHPLGGLMNRLELVYRHSYGGIGASKYLLPHAIAETHSLIQRIHGVVRILFPFLSNEDKNLSRHGHSRAVDSSNSDPDDYLSIESGYSLLHSLVFVRLFPVLINLYVLHHDSQDLSYKKGLNILKQMDDEKLLHHIHFPDQICSKLTGKNADSDIIKGLDEASNTLRGINSLFTPVEFLEHFKVAFKQLNGISQLSGDFLLPAIVYVLVKANIAHLGAYLHFLMDFAHTQPEDEYTLVTYEAAYNFIKRSYPPLPLML